MLLEVESKYGESITVEDIHGKQLDRKCSRLKINENNSIAKESGSMQISKHISLLGSCFKAPTDSRNKEFEESKKSYKPKDYLQERK